jgi:uncharacterized membrane protein
VRLDARRDRIETASGGLPRDIAALILFSSVVVVAYSGTRRIAELLVRLLGPAAFASVIAVSVVVLVDSTYPFSGGFAIGLDSFRTGGNVSPSNTARSS